MQISLQHIRQDLEKRLPHLLFLPYRFLIYIPVLILSTNFFALLVVTCISFGLTKAARKFPPMWARVNVYSALSKITVRGEEHIDPEQSYIIVANHNSHFDVLALYGWLNIDLRWIIKKELRKVPALGIACEKLGHVFVDRTNANQSTASINQIKSQIQGGTSVLFFPEGTRNEERNLKPFKKGAFKLANDLQLPILPITINGSHKVLPSNSLNLFPGNIDIIIHPQIDTKDASIQDLIQQSRRVISSAITE